ncbi:hypothetical protein M422DRAFT_240955 [Sphaerobolus stellatus SS14]|nr:hypothetical protein M422DRAFT_240955 [Sphaerobolus stellatus SS14]
MDFDDEIPSLIETTEGPAVVAEDRENHTRVPLTLICGFLGAGKSTLLKRILTERHGYRIAVIINEFSDTADIEARAIKVTSENDAVSNLEEASEELLELPNGCLCCSLKDTGVAAIEKLMSRRGAFDHILLETTGLADPGPIAAMFWQNEEYAEGLGRVIALDGVICVVDAVFAEKQIQEDTESDGIKHSLRQIGAADVVLLNKSDLVSEEQLEKTEALLRSINPLVPIYRTAHSEIDLSKILELDAYSDRLTKDIVPESVSSHAGCNDSCQEGTHDHQHKPKHGTHVGISSIVLPIPGPLAENQVAELDEWIRSALWDGVLLGSTSTVISEPSEQSDPDSRAGCPLEILRCKGIWWNDKKEQFVLQGVRNLYEISRTASSNDQAVDNLSGKIVFIGRGLSNEVESSLTRIIGSGIVSDS